MKRLQVFAKIQSRLLLLFSQAKNSWKLKLTKEFGIQLFQIHQLFWSVATEFDV